MSKNVRQKRTKYHNFFLNMPTTSKKGCKIAYIFLFLCINLTKFRSKQTFLPLHNAKTPTFQNYISSFLVSKEKKNVNFPKGLFINYGTRQGGLPEKCH